jgi:lipid II:glycine glycyltransferase (peptidoglycan interpeptide bridge formation enzyme)
MIIRQIRPEEKEKYNSVVSHPLQSWQWGEFREKTGQQVIRLGVFDGEQLTAGFQITIHKIPKISYNLGYCPKCLAPTEEVINAFKEIGKQNNCIFIKLEPNVGHLYQSADKPNNPNLQKFLSLRDFLFSQGCVYGRPLFTKYTFHLDLTKSEEELTGQMHPKTRYNIRLAKKHGVIIKENNSPEAFRKYLDLTFETAKRQQFYAHDKEYHRLMWETLQPCGIAHLLTAEYQSEIIVSWILFIYNDILYYPYGASSSRYREVMASNLMMWEAIRFGKSKNCRLFDLWGSLGPNPNPKDPWFGFHRFKQGYNPRLIEFIGSFDLVINKPGYKLFTLADNLRWKWLKLKASLPF